MECRFKRVFLKGLGISLPSRIVTSEEIEERLSPLYERLRVSKGRLELMTGISARRWGVPGLRPSALSVEAGRKALETSGIESRTIGCLIHAAVCRDFLEPATASIVHHELGLSSKCRIYDLSNACLGWLDGLVAVANMIELGQIESGLVVSGEDGRGLVESTIKTLNEDLSLTREAIKGRFASLTIGSGGIAAVLSSNCREADPQVLGGVFQCATDYHDLCQGGLSPGENTQTEVDMITQSETMLHAGVSLAARTWERMRHFLGWSPSDVDHFFTHQVGTSHRRMLFEKLELDLEKDFPTYMTLGNIGSASIGVTMALAAENRRLRKGDRAVLMGIGSGLVSMMLGIRW